MCESNVPKVSMSKWRNSTSSCSQACGGNICEQGNIWLLRIINLINSNNIYGSLEIMEFRLFDNNCALCSSIRDQAWLNLTGSNIKYLSCIIDCCSFRLLAIKEFVQSLAQWIHNATHLQDFLHGFLGFLAVDRERDLLARVGLVQVPHHLGPSLLQHGDVELECLVHFIQRLLILTRQPGNKYFINFTPKQLNVPCLSLQQEQKTFSIQYIF